MLNEDTIAAIITPYGVGAVSVVRVSGKESFSLIEKISNGKMALNDIRTHTIKYLNIYDGSEVIDDALVSFFVNPHSYTGEDSVEISVHGNPVILQKLFHLLFKNGIRQAEPGEFTKRAFLNGKLDLAQAEAVAEIITARADVSLRGARNQLDGVLSKSVKELRASLLWAISLVELELDFSEEDVEFIDVVALTQKLSDIRQKITALMSSYSFGRIIREGVNLVLVGAPNVGKSSILNYLLKESRAIVSEIPGTTRDIIREEFSLDGIAFKVYDTAGIRETDDYVEKEGVRRSREAVESADLVLFITDNENGENPELYNALLDLTSEDKIIRAVNKMDLISGDSNKSGLYLSALTGEGFGDLFATIKASIGIDDVYTERNAVVSNVRHYNCLREAKEALDNALHTIEVGLTGEFVSVDVRKAMNSLGEIIGEVSTDDILNNIFQKFCIGK